MQTDATVGLADATLEYVHFDRAANGANRKQPTERIKEGVLQKKILQKR